MSYLAHARAAFFLPVKPGRPEGYGGRSGPFPWPENVHEVPAEQVRDLDLDCVLFQSRRNFDVDQHELLSARQHRLPQVFLEHDPPREEPTTTRHPVDDPNVLLVHVTAFNDLMWESGRTPTRVVEHGVPDRGLHYRGELPRGIAVVNNMAKRGRRLGADVYARAAAEVPLDLVGMGAEEMGGLGEVPLAELPAFTGRYRFFFNPIRYTSLGLAVCEAMMAGMPVVGLATTEMVTVVRNGESGFLDTRVASLVDAMRGLLADPSEARRLGEGARRAARERFDIERFARDWEDTFAEVGAVRTRQFAAAAAGGA
jgi:glycosyltransferase involved in cell wall biosynthesis